MANKLTKILAGVGIASALGASYFSPKIRSNVVNAYSGVKSGVKNVVTRSYDAMKGAYSKVDDGIKSFFHRNDNYSEDPIKQLKNTEKSIDSAASSLNSVTKDAGWTGIAGMVRKYANNAANKNK